MAIDSSEDWNFGVVQDLDIGICSTKISLANNSRTLGSLSKIMLVNVTFYSFFRYIAGNDRLSVKLLEGTTLVDLMDSLKERFNSPAFSEKYTI